MMASTLITSSRVNPRRMRQSATFRERRHNQYSGLVARIHARPLARPIVVTHTWHASNGGTLQREETGWSAEHGPEIR
jgi:hypothetical protein